jgi:5-methylthioadenosine/S-adenosylhomocysteine deaminase
MTPRYQEAAQAATDIGIRAIVAPLGCDDSGFGDDIPESIALVEALGPQRGDRVRVWLGFDDVDTTAEPSIRAISAAARRVPIGIHTHLCETEVESQAKRGTKMLTGARYVADCGLLDQQEPILLAHCNWLESDEITLLASTRAVVAHCPSSNMRFGSGVCPVPDLLTAGVSVGLGTDGMLSNFNLDFFQVMRSACLLHRISRLNAAALSSAKAFEMAVVGARVFGSRSGTIEVGSPADLAVISMTGPRFRPRIDYGPDSNLLALLVWCASPSDVRDVVVDGRLVVQDGVLLTADIDSICSQAQHALDRMRAHDGFR